MAVTPNQYTNLAQQIHDIYAQAETIMLQRLAKRLERGIDTEGWTERKTREVQQVREEMATLLQELRESRNPLVGELLDTAYRGGLGQLAQDLQQAGLEYRALFGNRPSNRLTALVLDTNRLLDNSESLILRQTLDAYRQIIAETAVQAVAGTQTPRQAMQAALNRFADAGIAGFIDRAGRHWEMATYAEMATRTVLMKSSVQGFRQAAQAQGYDLYVVSAHSGACPLCTAWYNVVLSEGGTPGYPTVDEAVDAGLFHPNCQDSLNLYFPGLTRLDQQPSYADEQEYQHRQEQRYLERQVRHWQRRREVAITETAATQASAKVREWQAALREHTARYDLPRKYERESIRNRRPFIAPAGTLTYHERAAIQRYLAGESYTLNEKLRQGAGLSPREKSLMQHLDSALAKLPNYQGRVSRSLQFLDVESQARFLAQHQPQAEVYYPAYLSTTSGETYNPAGTVEILLYSQQGRDLRPFNPGEQEILYDRGRSFKVLKTTCEDGKYLIYLEETP